LSEKTLTQEADLAAMNLMADTHLVYNCSS